MAGGWWRLAVGGWWCLGAVLEVLGLIKKKTSCGQPCGREGVGGRGVYMWPLDPRTSGKRAVFGTHRSHTDRDRERLQTVTARANQLSGVGHGQMRGRAVLKPKKKGFVPPTETNVHGDALCFVATGPSLFQRWAAGGWWRLAVGGPWGPSLTKTEYGF